MTETLFERAPELDRAQSAVAVSKCGEGRVLMVLGPPGIGKTSVLKALSDDACAEGFAVLSAHGSEFEHGFPFALAQQLFAPALATTPLERSELLSGAARPAATVLGLEAEPGREVPGAGAQFAAIHSLYWLACNLAERAPLLLAIDDAQWSDTESLRWLAYLGKRLEGVPMMVAMAARESEPGTRWQDVEAVTRDTRADVIRPGPLSAAATERLCGERLGSPLDPGFVDACQRATGGNPFLLVEVLKTLVVERVRPTASEAERVRELGPQSVARAVLARTARLGSGPLELAKALAVLGDDSELGLAAEIAGLQRSEAEEAADALAAADVLGTVIPFEFIHPLVRASVYEDLPKAERGAKHARAARALADRGASADRIARHLLAAPPLGEQWAVDGLRRAARDALARGSPDLASRYLNRALIEPPSPVDRPFIHQELGASEALAWNAEGAAKHLAEGIESLDDLSEIATARRGRALVLFHLGRVSEAIDELQGVIAEVEHPAPELRLGLEADLASMREMSTVEDPHAVRERLEGLADGLDGVGAAERVLLACLSHARMRECEPATEVIELATRALAAGGWAELSGGPGVIGLSQAAMTLVCADEFDNAERFVERELVSSRELGSPFLVGMLTYFLSEIALRRGAIQEAEAQARFALELAREHGFMVGVAVSTHVLLSALIERGETDRAWEELASGGLTGELPDLNTFAFLIATRGRLLAARNEKRLALADLNDAGRRFAAWGVDNPAEGEWRSTAALAHLALGDRDAALRLSGEDVSRARSFGAPRALGIALRAHGLIEGGDAGIETLEEAVGVLADSVAPLEYARALVDLGARLRRERQRRAARERLSEGLVIARRSGAVALVERAYQELEATGARPRKIVRSGAEGLTPSERRVCRMAANGMTNKEIAQALFVTVKTVETHLSRAYQKLEIRSRSQLGEALQPPA